MSRADTSIVEASLRCFRRPVVWAAIAVLLLNDHYLKAAFPSWWTGKLSDVAGLFFFPFVVTVFLTGLQKLLGLKRFGGREIGRFTFILVGVWFALMKVNPTVNILTITFWEWLVNGPAFIVMDGSDLVALPVLIPAWRLWERELERGEERPKQQRRAVYDWRVWVVMGTAVFVAMATSCDTVFTYTRLVEFDGSVYVLGDNFDSGFHDNIGVYDPVTKEWNWRQGDIPEEVLAVDREPRPILPVTKCVPDQISICYRIEGDERVLASNDGGESWQKAWEVPPGRRYYMGRRPTVCKGVIDMGPYDLLISGRGDNYRVFVAAGNEGVLLRNEGGNWERQGVYNSYPTPFRGTEFDDIFRGTSAELFGTFLYFLFLFFIPFAIYLRQNELLRVPLVIVAIFVCSMVYAFGFDLYFFFILIVGLLFAGLILWIVYRRIGDSRKITDVVVREKAVLVWAGSSIGFLVIAFVLISLWVFGIVPYYWMMIVLLVGTAVWITVWVWKKNRQFLAESKALMAEMGWQEHIQEFGRIKKL